MGPAVFISGDQAGRDLLRIVEALRDELEHVLLPPS